MLADKVGRPVEAVRIRNVSVLAADSLDHRLHHRTGQQTQLGRRIREDVAAKLERRGYSGILGHFGFSTNNIYERQKVDWTPFFEEMARQNS